MIPVARHEARVFTLDDVEVDIEDFISVNSTTFEEARILREDIADMKLGYDMCFGGGAVPERILRRVA